MSDSPNPYAPPGESTYDLWVEQSNMNGVLLSGVAYGCRILGILFVITFQTILLFLKAPKRAIPWGLIAYMSVMFILASIGFGINANFNQKTFIDDRNFPGGPNAFTVADYATTLNMVGFTAYTIMSWMADGLVLWRFTMIWNYNYWLTAFPGLMFLGSIGSSITFIISIIQSEDTFWATRSIQLGIAYWSLSIALNIILTLAITTRIWLVRRRLRNALSLGAQNSGQYVSIVAMLIESAALYAVWSTVFLICYARNTPFQNILLPPLGQVQGIAPALILFRVAQGRAWSHDTANVTMSSASGRNRSIPLSNLTATANEAESQNVRQGLKINMTSDTVTEWDEGKASV
ncbi:hypothetical protein B0H11DRAFT_2374447 [Mycena galericulata]|nr:hypothetical protein B0H11DRAFT_2394320 [Mycena galericulata]KAJ7433883.1 hypothetical protein B0H11DRAFT_2374447 [Mycena galericulata]